MKPYDGRKMKNTVRRKMFAINNFRELLCHAYTVYTVRRKNFRDRKISRIASKRGAEIFATKIFAKAALIHCVIGASLSEPHMYE